MLGDNIVAFGHLHCVIFVHSIYYCVNSLVAVHGWHVVPSSGEYVYRCVCVCTVSLRQCVVDVLCCPLVSVYTAVCVCTVSLRQCVADVLCCPLVTGHWKLQLSALRALRPFVERFFCYCHLSFSHYFNVSK